MKTIETQLADARRLLNGAITEYERGSREYALNGIDALRTRITAVAEGMRAELADDAEALLWRCQCGYSCPVSGLAGGACPGCDTLREGVVLVPDEICEPDKWAARDTALLIRPQGHCVEVFSPTGERWQV